MGVLWQIFRKTTSPGDDGLGIPSSSREGSLANYFWERFPGKDVYKVGFSRLILTEQAFALKFSSRSMTLSTTTLPGSEQQEELKPSRCCDAAGIVETEDHLVPVMRDSREET